MGVDEDGWDQFVINFGNCLEKEVEIQEKQEMDYLTDCFQPDTGVVKRNALKYTKEYHERSLTLPKNAFTLTTRVWTKKVIENPYGEVHRCINGLCSGTHADFHVLPHDGSYVCTSCGAVQQAQIIQELDPFLWNYNSVHRNEYASSTSLFGNGGNSYQPKFHWNEDEKLRRLVAPPIPEFNRDIIFWKLGQMGFKRNQRVNNPKLVIQEACRLIDTENGVHVYGRKWGEHWMTIVAKYTYFEQKPPRQCSEHRADFATKFDWFHQAWPMCSHLLPGSKRDKVRSQLPQFRWIFRQLLVTFTPERFEEWAEWLPVLSKNKETELDVFWKKMCYVNGWRYRHPEPFIAMIKAKNKRKRTRKGSKRIIELN